MSAFAESADLLADFLAEAGELLDDVDIGLVELESRPDDVALLNTVFRGFHTIKGGAGFLDATPLVDLCHRTEHLLDQLRAGKLTLDAGMMDVILAATGEVRRMFGEMGSGAMPARAPATLLESIAAAAEGEALPSPATPASAAPAPPAATAPATAPAAATGAPDWEAYRAAVAGIATGVRGATVATPAAAPAQFPAAVPAARPIAKPAAAPRAAPRGGQAKENTLRVDTERFDQILNLSGEIGLTTNRLACLKAGLAHRAKADPSGRALEEAIDELDMLVGDLQNAVMKARMQPVGRVFQKYIRQARDLARSLGKDVELALEGEETEVDKTILDELNDPLVHLVRNAVDHGVETREERAAAGKPAKSLVRLSARQTGDHIAIEIVDDGRGMRPDVLRAKAVEKGLLPAEEAALLDDRQALQLIFLPGFSTKSAVTDVSGRGVGMDVVKTNIQRLKGRIDMNSEPGKGTRLTIRLPLTLAILPVLMLKAGGQAYAVPLGAVREIVELPVGAIQHVSGAPHVIVRGEVLPVMALVDALGHPTGTLPPLGVVVHLLDQALVLAVDVMLGQDEVMVKPVEGVKAKGVSGATISGQGELVLVLELHELLAGRFESAGAVRLAV
jgi:two-component system chemotaxis sensor kinase CheA